MDAQDGLRTCIWYSHSGNNSNIEVMHRSSDFIHVAKNIKDSDQTELMHRLVSTFDIRN